MGTFLIVKDNLVDRLASNKIISLAAFCAKDLQWRDLADMESATFCSASDGFEDSQFLKLGPSFSSFLTEELSSDDSKGLEES